MTGNVPQVIEQSDAPTIFVDGSVRYDCGDTIKVLLYQLRATEPGVADHVATVILTKEAYERSLVQAAAQIPAVSGYDETQH